MAGSVTTAIGLALDAKLPGATVLLAVGAIAFCGYGLSLSLFVLAQRHPVTAGTGAYFSIAPFVGAALAILFGGTASRWGSG